MSQALQYQMQKRRDMGVTDLKGMIGPARCHITICKGAADRRGGSRSVDLQALKKHSKNKPYIAAVGVEALIALRRSRSNLIFFSAQRNRSWSGISWTVIAVGFGGRGSAFAS